VTSITGGDLAILTADASH